MVAAGEFIRKWGPYIILGIVIILIVGVFLTYKDPGKDGPLQSPTKATAP